MPSYPFSGKAFKDFDGIEELNLTTTITEGDVSYPKTVTTGLFLVTFAGKVNTRTIYVASV